MTKDADLKGNDLIEALRETANRPMTPELARAQKVSGIMAGLPMDSTITREQVEAHLAEREGPLA